MKCPRDGTELSKVEVLGLELDKCHHCDGIWFDRGELERIRDAGVEGVEEVLERKYGDPATEKGEVEGYMRCPRCGDARLQRQHYTYANPVKIDRCERCHGVWVDDTELDAIVGEKKNLDEQENNLKGFLGSLADMFEREK
ncbi:MAG: zf-TFIIB domain-containing protein [Planctomycetota bacterium]